MTDAAQAWIDELVAADERWSDEQRAIYDWFETGSGNLGVRARAGTGKTTTAIEGVRRAPERRILMTAFNRVIADELTRRVSLPHVEAKTLHGLGYTFVRRAWNRVQIDRQRATLLAKGALPTSAPPPVIRTVRDLHTKAREIDPWILPPSGKPGDDARERIADLAERFDLTPDDALERAGWNIERVADAVLLALRTAKERTTTIDFADMIYLPLVHGWVRPTYQLVVVDECQDMTVPQLAIAVGSCTRDGRVAIVGDDRQAVYSFRGADGGSFDRLKRELDARELGLRTTYRCPRLVVEIAQKIVPDFVAHASAPDGRVDTVDVQTMVATAAPGDFVLSRKNAPLVRVCVALLRRGVRATVRGRDIGAGIVALVEKLRAVDPSDLDAKARAWGERECARAVERLSEEDAEERVVEILDQVGLVAALLEDVATLDAFHAKILDLFSDAPAADSVVCSSIHRAKGLEADTVYVLRATLRASEDGPDAGEESNLVYVAITRTKRRLVWVEGEP